MASDDKNFVEKHMMLFNIGKSTVGYLIFSYYKMYEHSNKTLSQIIFQGEFLTKNKSILFLSMIFSLITPVLGSLTLAYSDYTIILDYCVFVCIHMLYYDFEIIGKKPEWMAQEQQQVQSPTGSAVAVPEKKDQQQPEKKEQQASPKK